MDIITSMQMLLQLYFYLSDQSGKTREERDAMYDDMRKRFDALADPSTLIDTTEE